MRTPALVLLMAWWTATACAGQLRRPANEDNLRFWIQNMAAHRYSVREMSDEAC